MSEVKLYLGDCLEILPMLEAGSVGAVVTDPPYGTGTAEWDKEPPIGIWGEMRRICPNGPIAIFGYAKQLFRWSKYFDGMELIGYIVWYKYNEIMVSRGLTKVHQDITIWGRSIDQVKSTEVREPYGSTKDSEKYWYWSGNVNGGISNRITENRKKKGAYRHPDGKRCTDLWRIPAPGAGFNSHLRSHPNEKPLEAIDRLVRLLADQDGIVIDPFMGSGTTGVACVQTGRNFIGIEIDPNYYAIAEKRIKEAQQQLLLPLGAT